MNRPLLAEVGRFYMVPCVFVAAESRTRWMPAGGWVPTIGSKHNDVEHLLFDYQHYHVDWRFLSEAHYKAACGALGFPHGRVVTNGERREYVGATVLRRRKCRRPMPDFPAQANEERRAYSGNPTLAPAGRWAALERAHRCERLRPGNVCPHRGINLTPFARPDGTAVCPGHGLRWNLQTGELIARHEA